MLLPPGIRQGIHRALGMAKLLAAWSAVLDAGCLKSLLQLPLFWESHTPTLLAGARERPVGETC